MAKSSRIITLEQENEILKKKLEDSEKLAETMSKVGGVNIIDEMNTIRSKGKSTANSIEARVIVDHKNVTLWTKAGKPIGPLHPDNAIATLQVFAAKGIKLSATRPTTEEREAYAKSPEGIAEHKRNLEARAIKEKSRKSGQIEKLAREIANMAGQNVETINKILKAHEVRPLAETRN